MEKQTIHTDTFKFIMEEDGIPILSKKHQTLGLIVKQRHIIGFDSAQQMIEPTIRQLSIIFQFVSEIPSSLQHRQKLILLMHAKRILGDGSIHGQFFECQRIFQKILLILFSYNILKSTPPLFSGFNMALEGYIYVLIENVTIDDLADPVKVQLSLSSGSKTSTAVKPSGSVFNEVFLMEVPKEPTKLSLNVMNGENVIGDCRYDITPFYEHAGGLNAMESDLYGGEENKKVGKIKFKLTFYPAKYGKLRVRIFNLELAQGLADQFKQARIKVRFGIHAQSTPVQSLKQPFDSAVEVLVLQPTMALSFDLVHQQGILATYSIPNAEEGKMLNKEIKAFQVSLFNNDKPIALIKYQLDWIVPEEGKQ